MLCVDSLLLPSYSVPKDDLLVKGAGGEILQLRQHQKLCHDVLVAEIVFLNC